MKHFICLVLVQSLAFSAVACSYSNKLPASSEATQTTVAANGTFMVGFGKVDITPEEYGVPQQLLPVPAVACTNSLGRLWKIAID